MDDDDIPLPERKVSDRDLQYVKLTGRRKIWLKIVAGISIMGIIGMSGIPMSWAAQIADSLAGKTTVVNSNIEWKLAAGIALTGFGAFFHWLVVRMRIKRQGEELTRARGREEKLEKETDEKDAKIAGLQLRIESLNQELGRVTQERNDLKLDTKEKLKLEMREELKTEVRQQLSAEVDGQRKLGMRREEER